VSKIRGFGGISEPCLPAPGSPSTLAVAVVSLAAEAVAVDADVAVTKTTHGCLIHGLASLPAHTHSSPSYTDTLCWYSHTRRHRTVNGQFAGGGRSAWPDEHNTGSDGVFLPAGGHFGDTHAAVRTSTSTTPWLLTSKTDAVIAKCEKASLQKMDKKRIKENAR
jgi:hypothetical protein